jgi:hypothetical protein
VIMGLNLATRNNKGNGNTRYEQTINQLPD